MKGKRISLDAPEGREPWRPVGGARRRPEPGPGSRRSRPSPPGRLRLLPTLLVTLPTLPVTDSLSNGLPQGAGEVRASLAILRVGACRWGCAAGAFVALALLIGAAPSLAQEKAQENIGGAMVVVNKVDGALPTGKIKVIQGDAVFRDEGVTTDADSSAKLVLKDDTNITIGPKPM